MSKRDWADEKADNILNHIDGKIDIPLRDAIASALRAATEKERASKPSEWEEKAERNFRWLYLLLLALAKRCLVDMNATAGNEWPAGQTWDELVSSSHAVFLRQARKEAGIPHDEFLNVIRSGESMVEDLYDIAAEDTP